MLAAAFSFWFFMMCKIKIKFVSLHPITDMRKERETANKYRQQALEGNLMAMNNMGVCYAQGIGVVEDHAMAFI